MEALRKVKHISELTKQDLELINIIVFDVDGVLVPRGTRIKSTNTELHLQIKPIAPSIVYKILMLHNIGYDVNINSGRGLYMLQMIFREILQWASLTYENGSATWIGGDIVQHVNSFDTLKYPMYDLLKIQDPNIKGWEPKEFIITIHCWDRVPQIEKVVDKYKAGVYWLWNGEAYDIGMRNTQTKANGINALMKDVFHMSKENIMVIGDNYNDKEMMAAGGIAVTADKYRVDGDFWVELEGDKLPGEVMIDKILELEDAWYEYSGN